MATERIPLERDYVLAVDEADIVRGDYAVYDANGAVVADLSRAYLLMRETDRRVYRVLCRDTTARRVLLVER